MKNKLTLKKITGIFLFLMLFPIISSAIVNVDGLHFKGKKKIFSADIEFKLNGSTGNTNNSKIALDSQFSWIKEDYINLAIVGYQYGETNNVENTNNAFVHLRHIHKFAPLFDYEIFTQLEQNDFTRLVYRSLVGAGVRYNVIDSTTHQAFIGAGAFATNEKIKFISGLTDHGVKTNTRANLYFLSKNNITSTISFTNTLYYQPDIEKPSDFRALLQSKLDFEINDRMKFRLSLDVAHNSQPSQTVKETDTHYLTGLVLSF